MDMQPMSSVQQIFEDSVARAAVGLKIVLQGLV
jgi:hypothetical protein